MGKLTDFLASNKDAENEYQALIENVKKEAREEGIASERARLATIDQIAGHVSQELVHNAKYVEPINAEQLALKALQKSAVTGSAEPDTEPVSGSQAGIEQPELSSTASTVNMDQLAKIVADYVASNAARVQTPAKDPLTGSAGIGTAIADQMAKDASASVSKYL